MIKHFLQTQLTDSMVQVLHRKIDSHPSSLRFCLLLWNPTHPLPLAQNFITDVCPEAVEFSPQP